MTIMKKSCIAIALWLVIASVQQQQVWGRPLKFSRRSQGGATLRVLAIGDSITQGSVPTKNLNHPYTIELQKRLQQAFPGKEVIVDNNSVGGAGIFAVGFSNPITLLQAHQQSFDKCQATGSHYDYVVVMLGINDLLRMGRSAEDVKGGLLQIWKAWLEAGSSVVAIPPFAAPGFVSESDYKEAERHKLAEEIEKAELWWKNNHPGRDAPAFIGLNLQAQIDFYRMSGEERSSWLDDGLHFTEAGYDRLGRRIGRAIVNAVKS